MTTQPFVQRWRRATHSGLKDAPGNVLTLIAVGHMLANFGDSDGGNIRPALGTLSGDTGVSVRTLSRAIGVLIEWGFLKRTQESYYGRPAHYRLTLPEGFPAAAPQPDDLDHEDDQAHGEAAQQAAQGLPAVPPAPGKGAPQVAAWDVLEDEQDQAQRQAAWRREQEQAAARRAAMCPAPDPWAFAEAEVAAAAACEPDLSNVPDFDD